MILEYYSLLNDEGMPPFNKFPKRARTLKLDNSPILKGMGPNNRLFPKWRNVKLYQSGSGEVSCPSKLLKLKYSIHRPWNVPKYSVQGSFSLNWFPLLVQKDSGVESFPFNLFLKRSNHLSCGDNFQSHSSIVSKILTLRRIIW